MVKLMVNLTPMRRVPRLFKADKARQRDRLFEHKRLNVEGDAVLYLQSRAGGVCILYELTNTHVKYINMYNIHVSALRALLGAESETFKASYSHG